MAASATVGILRVLLTADSAEFDSAMKQASATAKSWAKDLGDVGRQATAIGLTLTKAITVPLVGLGAASVKMAMDFESSFAGVRKTVDATEPEFAQLAQGLRNMAKEIPVNVNELNKVAEAAGQLGIKKDDILQFTRTMADLGVTTNLTADEAATATAQIQNIFGAAGQDVDRFGATLVALGNAGASTEKDIIAMGLRIAGAGHQIGLTQAQVLAFASALSSVGINAEAGGSAISRVFLKINDAVAKGGDDLAEFARVAGMTGAQFAQAFQTDAAGATTAFIEGLGRLKTQGENVNSTIEGLVGKNIILKDTLLRASGAGALLHDQLKLGAQAWTENTALTKEAEERYKTFESQVKLLWADVRDLGITLGQALIPTLRDLITVARPVVAQIADAAKWFGELPQPVRNTVIAIGGIVAALGPAIFLFGQVALGAQAIVGAFGTAGIATRAITGLMGLAGTQSGVLGMALGALGPAIAIPATAFAAWNIGKWLGEITGLTDGVGKLTAKLGEFLGILPAGTAAQYDASRAAVAAAQSATTSTAAHTQLAVSHQQAGATAGAAAPPIVRLGRAVGEAGEKAKDATREYREFMNWVGERQMEAAGQAIAAMDAIAASFQKGLQNIVPFKAAVTSTGEALRLLNSGLTATGLIVVRTAEELAEAARETAEWVRQHGLLKEAVKQTGTTLEAEVPKWSSLFQSFADGLPNVILGAIQGGGDAIKSAGVFAGNTVGSWLSTTFGAAIKTALPFGIGAAINALLPSLGALFAPLISKIGGFFRNLFGGPSGSELLGRERVAAFEDELAGMLNASQEAESEGLDWKKTIIAIRDAYIAAGISGEEALTDAKRLWDSSRVSAEEAARVIEEIRRKMAALPTEHTIVFNVETNESGTSTPEFRAPGGFIPESDSSTVLRAARTSVPVAGERVSGAAAAAGGSVVNNFVPVVVPAAASGDAWAMARAIRKQLPTAITMNEDGIREALERVIGDYTLTYGHG